MAKLGEYIDQIRGVSYKPEDLHDCLDENSCVLLRANNISNGEINYDDVVFVDKKRVKDTQKLRKGDILVCASSGSKDLVGKAAYVMDDTDVTFGAFCKVIRPKCSNRFIGYFFDSPYYRQAISKASAGANINNIRNEDIDQMDIFIPDDQAQLNVNNILDTLYATIKARRYQLKKLDELVKSRNVGQFDCARNGVAA